MIVQLLGKDINSYIKIYKKFQLKTVIEIGIQLIKCIKQVHNKKIIHRDLKPENIVVGSGVNNNKIYIIDFGISKLFCDKQGKPLPLKTNKNFLGTTRYASIAAHEGNEQSQKDDLESLGYVLFFILKGSLPWQNLKFQEHEKNHKIAELKKDFVKNSNIKMPLQLKLYFSYVYNLQYAQKPDYDYLIELFNQISVENNFIIDKTLQWNSKFDIKSVSNTLETRNSQINNFVKQSFLQLPGQNQIINNSPESSNLSINTNQISIQIPKLDKITTFESDMASENVDQKIIIQSNMNIKQEKDQQEKQEDFDLDKINEFNEKDESQMIKTKKYLSKIKSKKYKF